MVIFTAVLLGLATLSGVAFVAYGLTTTTTSEVVVVMKSEKECDLLEEGKVAECQP